MDVEFASCIAKAISRLYPGPALAQKELRQWIMRNHESPGPNAQSWLQNKLNRDFSEIDIRLLKEIFSLSIAALQKESCHRTIGLPGYGYPIDWIPNRDKCFHTLIEEIGGVFPSPALLVREICMLRVIEDITNEPEWCSKCIAELRSKASLYEKTGLIPVLDYSVCVLKADKLISHSLSREMITGANKLESSLNNIRTSDSSVLYLIDPSLCPLIYGRSRILPNRTISLTNCLEACGNGDITLDHAKLDDLEYWENARDIYSVISRSFQWLPCDVDINRDGLAKIVSYINNLHPSKHADMYTSIQKFIQIALPAWDIVYQWPKKYHFQRMDTGGTCSICTVPDICGDNECSPNNAPTEIWSHYQDSDGDDHEQSALSSEAPNDDDVYLAYDDSEDENEHRNVRSKSKLNTREKWFNVTHPMYFPKLKESTKGFRLQASNVCRANFFTPQTRRIQVIASLTSIHLTPENPHYKGGVWNWDGLSNERIVSTARFYYDSDNVSSSYLYFRSLVSKDDINDVLHDNVNDCLNMERAFGVSSRTAMFQDIGRVRVRPGGSIFYPSSHQHRDGPFSLVDRSRPGHCKFLTLHLVDPAITIISTANVPPQQKHWWTKSKVHHQGMEIAEKLPPELCKMVHSYVDMPIDHDEAEEIRQKFLEDRYTLKQELYVQLDEWRWND
ncbi:hypothetical protein V8C35DRAFT_329123 [Trichoderma chlorosporum]